MKRIFVHAYLAGNFGDDLFVYILCRRYPKIRFRIFADSSYKKTFAGLPNLKVCDYNSRTARFWDHLWKKLKKTDNGFWKMLIRFSDGVVHIGGSSFVQHSEDFGPFLESDRTLRRLGKKMYLIGSNFGPYTDENYYTSYHRLFATYDAICFRDSYSYGLFRDLDNVRWAPDVAYNLQYHSRKQEKKMVLISAIDMKERGGKYPLCSYTDAYEKVLGQILEYFLARGYEVVFLSLCEAQGDARAMERVLEKTGEKGRIPVFHYRDNLREALDLFAEAQIVVGTRFHSLVMGWLNRKQVYPIVYDKKIQNTLEDLHYNNYLRLEDLESFRTDQLEHIERLEDREVDRLIAGAQEQFAAFDQLAEEWGGAHE